MTHACPLALSPITTPLIVAMPPVCIESRGAICKVVKFTTEPKSAEIRRLSQKTIIALFDLNPATFSLLQRSLSKSDQDNANKILKTYMSELPNSGDESDKEATPTHKERKLSSKVRVRTQTVGCRYEGVAVVCVGKSPNT